MPTGYTAPIKDGIDAMLAFREEGVTAERSDAVDAAIALCYADGEINAAEALERNKNIISKLSCVEKGGNDAKD